MSLQRRLGVGIGVSLALVLLAVWVAVGWSTRRLSEDYVASRLEHDAESLLAALSVTPTPTLNTDVVGAVYRRPYSGHYYTVAAGATTLRSRSLWDETLSLAAAGEERITRMAGPQAQALLVYARRYTRDGVPVDIAVAEDLAPMERSIDQFQRVLGLIFVIAVALVLAGTRLGIRRGLAPLEQLRDDVARIERGEAAGLSAAAPAEVAPLVEAINHLLRLTAQRLARSRTALGDLAHALKTPLALILQTADEPANTMTAPARARLRSEAERIGALIERELGRARVAGAAGPGQRFRPAADVPALLEVIRGLYADRHLAIAQSVPARSYAVDREDMLELLGNLLDNAAKWARGRLQVTVADAADLRLCVEDDGPGCSGDELAQITGRGVRLDEAVPGSGLGLSIVRAIVDGYGGTLTLGRSEALGGLRVEVRFPAHPG